MKLFRLPVLALTTLLATGLLSACGDTRVSIEDGLYAMGVNAERTLSGLSKHEITTDSHHWVYLDSAAASSVTMTDEKPIVLMLHGFATDKDNWIRFARYFDGYRVIIPDLPGHGETDYHPELTYDFVNQSRWLNEFLTALKLNDAHQPLHIIGNSMGGGISVLYAHAHPQWVKTVTLIDAAGVYPPEPSELQNIIDNGGKNPLVVTSRADFDHLRAFAMEDQPFLPWPAPDVLTRQSIKRQAVNEKIFADIHQAAEAANTSDDHLTLWQELKHPVLILWGKEDRALDVSSVQVLEQHINNAQSYIFEGVGHAPMLERPKQSAEKALAFISEVN